MSSSSAVGQEKNPPWKWRKDEGASQRGGFQTSKTIKYPLPSSTAETTSPRQNLGIKWESSSIEYWDSALGRESGVSSGPTAMAQICCPQGLAFPSPSSRHSTRSGCTPGIRELGSSRGIFWQPQQEGVREQPSCSHILNTQKHPPDPSLSMSEELVHI